MKCITRSNGKYIGELDIPYRPIGTWIDSLHINSSGTRIAIEGGNETLEVWDLQNRTILQTFGKHTASVRSAAIDVAGKIIVSGGDDGTIRLWDVATGQPIRVIYGHEQGISSVIFSSDGNHIFSASYDGTIRKWRTTDGTLIYGFNSGLFGGVTSLDFSADETKIIASGGGNIRIWDSTTRSLLHTFQYGHQLQVATFDPSGTIVAGGTTDGKILIWRLNDVASNKPYILSSHSGSVNDIDFSSNGEILVSAGSDKAIKLWNMPTNAVYHTFLGHSQQINSVQFSTDDTYLVSAGSDGTAKLWDVQKLELVRTLSGHHNFLESDKWGQPESVNIALFSYQGDLVITASNDETIRVWNVVTSQPMSTFALHDDEISSIALSPDGTLLASSGTNLLRLWDLNYEKEIYSYVEYGTYKYDSWSDLAFSQDGQLFAGSRTEGVIYVWGTDTRELLHSFKHVEDSKITVKVSDIEFSPNGELFASTGGGVLVVRKFIDKKILYMYMYDSYTSQFGPAKFSPDGKILAYHDSFVIYIIDADSGTKIGQINDVAGTFAFSPDSRFIMSISPSTGNQLQVWNSHTGELIRTFQESIGKINSIVFHPNGQIIGTAHDDHTVALWDFESATVIRILQGHTDSVNEVLFTPDGSKIISAGSDHTIRIWLADINRILKLAEARIQRSPPILTNVEKEIYGVVNASDNTVQSNIDSLQSMLRSLLRVILIPEF